MKKVLTILNIFLLLQVLSSCGGNASKPSMCDCRKVNKSLTEQAEDALGLSGPDPELRAAAIRIMGNADDDPIDNPDRAALRCRVTYKDEFTEWHKTTNDPNRMNGGEWTDFFTQKCN
jgi:hypothetical protein